ncbi:MAG: isocitrate dehydrogenase (NADP(+)) [candidate division Zixibacteria bacterium]|nr:isocitrate dehydrogenase (NADP(+)) [candidate division Zixibacteria bacterium]
MAYKMITPPEGGEKITIVDGELKFPDNPIIPVIEGDGIGRDIMKAARRVLDASVEKSYGGKKKIVWFDVFAGEAANDKYGEWLPQDTIDAIRDYIVAIKGPLTTPVGGGFRSLNVTLRQVLDLYACVRPVKFYKGTPSPVKAPERMDIVIFRENTEDVYAGIEYRGTTDEADKVRKFLVDEMGAKIRENSGIGIKPISAFGSKRLVAKGIQYAIDRGCKSVTLMHKGNIMKYTEGAFRDWGYEVAAEKFADITITEDELWEKYDGKRPEGKIVIKDRIADSMFQQILTRTDEYEVVCTPNLNGDYISDAAAAQVGGLGMAAGANIGDYIALFEATHGTAPKYADKDVINPSSVILSGVMMLRYLQWNEAADMVESAIETTIQNKTVTYDLERQMEGATKVGTSQYATHIIDNMK